VSVNGEVARTVQINGDVKRQSPNEFRAIAFEGELIGFVAWRKVSDRALYFHDTHGSCPRSVTFAEPIMDVEVLSPAPELASSEILVLMRNGIVVSVKDGLVSEWFVPRVVGMPPRRACVNDVAIALEGTASPSIVLTTSYGFDICDPKGHVKSSAQLGRDRVWISRQVAAPDGTENVVVVPSRPSELQCVTAGGESRWRGKYDRISSGSYCVDVAVSHAGTKVAIATRNGLVMVVCAACGVEQGRFNEGVWPRLLWRQGASPSDEIVICASHHGLVALKPVDETTDTH
jgi:hypothetical protein